MRSAVLFTVLLVLVLQSSGRAGAEGTPLLTEQDKSFLERQLGIGLDDDRICQLTRAEATRLHRFIRTGEVADVQAYLDIVTLDQVSDSTHHVPRADQCVNTP